jgi:phosphomannomutase
MPQYLDHLLSIVEPAGIGPLRVVADGGNGMAGVVLGGLFDRLEADLTGLYLEPDGTFPNHPADPLDRTNLDDLIRKVRSEGADAGVAFDGDADRAVFADEDGEPLSGSVTTSIISRWYLRRRPGSRIVHNLICSKWVSEAIRAEGGVPVRTRVGHSFIKRVMADTGAVFGGEHSGHYYFRDNYRADSGMLAMLVLLTALTEAGVPLSVLRRANDPYAMSGEINTVVPDAVASIEAVAAEFSRHEQDRLDGLTVDLGDRWFNLRPSNTEPLLRLNVEAPDRDGVDELAAEVIAVISSMG